MGGWGGGGVGGGYGIDQVIAVFNYIFALIVTSSFHG